MPNWKNLEKSISDWLKNLNPGRLQFRNAYQAIVGFPFDGFRSDGMLSDDSFLLAIEVEAGQTHPDTNTSKYWLLNDRYKPYSRNVLFHIFTPDFNSYGRRKELAEFIVDKMKSEVSLEYIQLDYRHYKLADYDFVLSDVKNKITEKTKELFGVDDLSLV